MDRCFRSIRELDTKSFHVDPLQQWTGAFGIVRIVLPHVRTRVLKTLLDVGIMWSCSGDTQLIAVGVFKLYV